jgi:protein-S-isoprenylcysteine O-methyltransferase Ste14
MTSATYSSLPRRSRLIKSRGTIAILVLAPFLIVSLLTPAVAVREWWAQAVLDAVGWACFVGGVAFRFWAAAYIGGRKGQALSTEGPYSICRNPLYFGTWLILVALVAMFGSLAFAIGALAASLVYLGMTIHDEERRLRLKFGPAYAIYCRLTPRFFPRWKLLQTPDRVEVNVAGVKRECRSAALYLWLPIAARWLSQLRDSDAFLLWIDLR